MLRFTLVAAAIMLAAPVWAQQPPLAGAGPDMTPGELQRMFDALVVVQAREQLQLTEAQYPDFIARLTKVQETRLANQQERQRLLRELQGLLNDRTVDEALAKERMAELRRHETEAAAEVAAAYAALDEVLDLRQQVRFRLFEERMERRRIELLMRAARRPQQPQRRPQ